MPDADRRPEERPSLPLASYQEERPSLPFASYREEPMVLEPSEDTTLTQVPYEGKSGSSPGAADPSQSPSLTQGLGLYRTACGTQPEGLDHRLGIPQPSRECSEANYRLASWPYVSQQQAQEAVRTTGLHPALDCMSWTTYFLLPTFASRLDLLAV
ncbi:hypothetical protein UY3_07745 [Chelonia mydas]|uniref:Uncharacterized protein n=1 Tax=Chelonia mydas TaxID=8469 RepID=M7BAV2_CHEMY|nr:hypothetical protein UY3_07745 [Chelonia mydas]